MDSFQKIVPYLTNPFAIIGYFLFLLFGIYRLLLTTKILPPLDQQASGKLTNKLFNYGFILAMASVLLGFVKEVIHPLPVPLDGQAMWEKMQQEEKALDENRINIEIDSAQRAENDCEEASRHYKNVLDINRKV